MRMTDCWSRGVGIRMWVQPFTADPDRQEAVDLGGDLGSEVVVDVHLDGHDDGLLFRSEGQDATGQLAGLHVLDDVPEPFERLLLGDQLVEHELPDR